MLNISETKRFGGSCPIGTLQESAYCASIGDVIDDVSWLYDVILVTSQFSRFLLAPAFANYDPDLLSVWTL